MGFVGSLKIFNNSSIVFLLICLFTKQICIMKKQALFNRGDYINLIKINY